jgi:hypothetical protein
MTVKQLFVILCFISFSISLFSQEIMTNTYHQQQNIPVLPSENVVVYAPGSTWHYNHHPHLIAYKGKLIAVWSNGITGEDLSGQRVLISSSSDYYNWAPPSVLIAPNPDSLLWTPGGLHVYKDTLVAYVTLNSPKRTIVDFCAIYSVHGVNGSAPVDLSVTTYPSHSPTILSTGRILLTGNTAVYYTDDPSGLRGWKRAGVTGGTIPALPALVEGTLIEKDNHTIVCMLRSVSAGYKNYNWQMHSNDYGKTFSVPVKTNFTDNNSKSHLGRLPNGEYFYIGTPDTSNINSVRFPLVLSLSKDGVNFDRNYIAGNTNYTLKYTGRAKNGEYGYPHAYVHENYLYVFYSKIKEQMELIRIPLSSFMLPKHLSDKYPYLSMSDNPVITGDVTPSLVTGWIESPASVDTSPKATVTIENGAIVIRGINGTQARFQTVEGTMPTDIDFSIEVKSSVVPYSGATNAGRGLDIDVHQGTAISLITIDENSLQSNGQSPLCTWNNEQTYHTFRFLYQKDNDSILCFVNNAYVGNVKSAQVANSGVQPYIRFGKGNSSAKSEIRIDYLNVNTSGNYLPGDGPTTSIEDTISDNFFIYPNPCNDYFSINGYDKMIDNLSVYSIDGKCVMSIGGFTDNHTVNVGSLKDGIYLVKIISGNQSKILKLIIN